MLSEVRLELKARLKELIAMDIMRDEEGGYIFCSANKDEYAREFLDIVKGNPKDIDVEQLLLKADKINYLKELLKQG